MRSPFRVLRCSIAFFAVACSAAPEAPQVPVPSRPAQATLTGLEGQVTVKPSDRDDWRSAVEGMELKESDKVRTAPGGSAKVSFKSGASVVLGEDALIAISERSLTTGRDGSDLTVMRGRVDAKLPDTREQSLSVSTPSATVRAGREIVFQ